MVSIEMIGDDYYRPSSHGDIVRRPVGELQHIDIKDQVLMIPLYELHPTNLKNWNLTFAQVYAWTESIAGGKIPSGFDSMEEFENHLRVTCGQRYKEEAEKLAQKAAK